MNNGLPRIDGRRIATATIAVALLLAATTAAAAPCLKADVEQPVVLPDGSEHEAGTLRICLTRTYSPVAALHETTIGAGGHKVMLRSHVGRAEGGESAAPYVLFEKAGRSLRLIGFAWPAGDEMTTYRVAWPAERGARMTRETGRDEPGTTEVASNEGVVLVVAGAN